MKGSATRLGNLPLDGLTTPGAAEIRSNPFVLEERNRARDPESHWGLGIGRVVAVDPDRLTVTLRIIMGASDDQPRMPVQVPFPGAGRQHFLGAQPQLGDYALVGWMPQESQQQRARTPICLGWILPGLQLGLLSARSSLLSEQDADLDDPTVRGVLGADAPIRYRSIGVGPDEIVLSSPGRTDLVLGSGAELTAQGGAGMEIRGDDDSIVSRAVQMQLATAGVRTYQGPVRRDGLLPPVGILGSDLSVADRAGHKETDLIPAANLDEGPGRTDRAVELVDPELDPYRLWTRLGWAKPDGTLSVRSAQALQEPDVVTTDARRYRFVQAGPETQARYTEFRVESAFETPAELPITDLSGADLERLPDEKDQDPQARPQVRLSLGTVVGNDPFRAPTQYGKPLRMITRPGGIPAGRIETGQDPAGFAAYLVEVELDPNRIGFIGLDRSGRFRANLFGTPQEPGFDLVSQGRVAMWAGGIGIESELGGTLSDRSGVGWDIKSDRGPIRLSGGGTTPVQIGAPQGSVSIQAGLLIEHRAPQVQVLADSIGLGANQDLTCTVGGRAALSCQTGSAYFAVRREEHHSGDRGPIHKRTYAPSQPGQVCEEIKYESGSREELFKQGSHRTQIRIGNLTYETDQGRVRLRSGGSQLDLDREGIRGEAQSGSVSLRAASGSATLEGLTSVEATTSGTATVRGSVVLLRAQIVKGEQGPILSGGTIDPLTGLPFSTWGLGSPTHLLNPS